MPSPPQVLARLDVLAFDLLEREGAPVLLALGSVSLDTSGLSQHSDLASLVIAGLEAKPKSPVQGSIP